MLLIEDVMVNNRDNVTSPIPEFRHHDKDTGSVEVQIINLTDHINRLKLHLQKNAKDFSSERGMIKMVSQRKKLLAYLQKYNPERYKKIIEQLGIRK